MDVNDFTGIPWKKLGSDFDGCDCWGLCVLFYRHLLGRELASHTELRHTALEDGVVHYDVFAGGFEPTDEPGYGDILHMWGLFTVQGQPRKLPIHSGIYLGNQQILHVEREGDLSKVGNLTHATNRWRPIQFYRLRDDSSTGQV